MGIERALFYQLTTDATVGPLVVSVRVFPAGTVPAEDEDATLSILPRVVLQCLTDIPVDHQGGLSDLQTDHWQITCWDDKTDDVHTLATAVCACLDAFEGAMGEAGATVAVCYCRRTNRMDHPLYPTEGGAKGPLGVILDFEIQHRG